MGTGAENLLALIEFTHRLEYLVQTIFSDMKNKSVKLPFVTKNSKHLVGTLRCWKFVSSNGIYSLVKNKSVKLPFVNKN